MTELKIVENQVGKDPTAKKGELPFALNVPDIANLLGVNKTRAYELANRRGFPAIKIGKRIVIPRDAFLRWIDQEAG